MDEKRKDLVIPKQEIQDELSAIIEERDTKRSISPEEAGAIGGEMVRRMIERYERELKEKNNK